MEHNSGKPMRSVRRYETLFGEGFLKLAKDVSIRYSERKKERKRIDRKRQKGEGKEKERD